MISKDALDRKSKKELIEIVVELSERLIKLKELDTQQNASETSRTYQALGVSKDGEKYMLNFFSYDPKTKSSAFQTTLDLGSTDIAIATYQAKKYLIERIIAKAKGGKYVD